MRAVGNSLIIIGQIILLAIALFFAISFVLSFIFGCTGGFTSDVVCERGGSGVEDLLSFIAGWLGVSAFFIIPITAPLFGVGLLIRVLSKANTTDSASDTLDSAVAYFWGVAFIMFKFFLAVSLWWITLIIFCYQAFRLKSIGGAFTIIKNFILK